MRKKSFLFEVVIPPLLLIVSLLLFVQHTSNTEFNGALDVEDISSYTVNKVEISKASAVPGAMRIDGFFLELVDDSGDVILCRPGKYALHCDTPQ